MGVLSLIYPFSVALLWSTLIILIKDTRTSSVYGMGISLIGGVTFSFLLAFLFARSSLLSVFEFSNVFLIAAIGFMRYLLGIWFLYESIKIGDISVSIPITGYKVIIVSIMSVLLGVENFTPTLWLAVILSVAGFMVITLHIKSLTKMHRLNLIKSMLCALGAVVCWSIADIWVMKVQHIPPLTLTFGSLLFAFVCYYILVFSLRKYSVIFNMPSFELPLFSG